MYIVILLFGLGIVAKLFHVQFAYGDDLKTEAEHLIYDMRTIEAPKGNIYAADEQKRALAISVPRYNLAMDPFCVSEKDWQEGIDSLAYNLAAMFPRKTKGEWKNQLVRKRRDSVQYVVIHNKATYAELQKVKQFPIFRKGKFKGGLIATTENQRVKPYGQLAKRTIGYTKINDKGKRVDVGLEGAYRKELQGRDGQMLMKKIGGNQWKPIPDEFSVDPINGHDVYTTIDVNIQDVAQEALMKQLQDQQAARGCAILMEVETGHIKAIVNLERAGDGQYYEMFNMSVGRRSEPGSTFKLASLMVALDDGKVRITDTVNAVGKYHFYDKTLKDSRSWGYGKIPLSRAFEVSSNVIAKVIDENYKSNPQQFVDGLREIGLDKKLGLEIAGEKAPFIKDADRNDFSGISLPWMAIGYELEITPLQTLAFYNAVANNGKMVKPQFVKEIREGDKLIRKVETEVLNESICKPSTLKDVQFMLKGVVQNGTAKNIRPRGFDIAGKTGTVQLIGDNGSYSDKHQASFCGYFPADNPKYSCIVLVQGPSKDIYGSIVSGTVFKEIADKVYASSIEINQSQDDVVAGDLTAPKPKYGAKAELLRVLDQLNVPLTDEAEGSDWVVASTDGKKVKIENRKVEQGIVPNVVGMGLVDALHVLESAGLYVEVRGSGTVKRQSMASGIPLRDGATIIIELI